MTFLLLFLVLVATGFLEPIPIWRPLSIFIAGLAAIFFTVMEHDSSGRSLSGGAYYAMGWGLGLWFLAALQVRRILMTRRPIA